MASEIASLTTAAEELLPERLGTHGVEHSRRAAAIARDLACVYGVDGPSAFLGGLLHDWAKDLPDEELLAEAERLGLSVTDVDRQVPYLLHAAVAAGQLADDVPGVPPDVLRAIERHTLGAPEMSELDMVVFLADMLEPARVFAGVEELRASIGRVALAQLYADAYAKSITHVVETRRHLHPASVAAWNAAVAAADEGGEA